ncbi:MAG: hypothetical protein MRY63_13835 [Neomegalonema sp.]|nr:hypothetical protein [Neomegalonema sp.]
MSAVLQTFLGACIVGGALWVYGMKEEIAAKRELVAELEGERDALNVTLETLEAEWAYINAPERLERLASKLRDHRIRALGAPKPEQVATTNDLPWRREALLGQ